MIINDLFRPIKAGMYVVQQSSRHSNRICAIAIVLKAHYVKTSENYEVTLLLDDGRIANEFICGIQKHSVWEVVI